jgi:hypothetical protein
MSANIENPKQGPTFFRDSLFRRTFLNFVLALPLWWLRRRINKKLTTLESTIRTFELERERSLRLGMPNYAAIHEASLFLVLFSYDLTVLRADCLSEFRGSRKNFYARQLCLLIYEGLDDLVTVLGKPLREAVEGLTNDPEILSQLGLCTKKLNQLKKTHEPELGEIRNAVAAHREHRPHIQLQVIAKMDHKRIDALANGVDVALHAIVLCLSDTARLMGQPAALLRNIRMEDAQKQPQGIKNARPPV